MSRVRWENCLGDNGSMVVLIPPSPLDGRRPSARQTFVQISAYLPFLPLSTAGGTHMPVRNKGMVLITMEEYPYRPPSSRLITAFHCLSGNPRETRCESSKYPQRSILLHMTYCPRS